MSDALVTTRPAKRARSLETWIADAFNDPDKESPCTALALIHKVGMADTEIHTIRITQGAKSRSPKDLAEMFWNRAYRYAADLPGAQTFNLLAFYGRSEPESRQPFLITPEPDHEGLATEGPTATGSLQQNMRITEALVQGTFRERGVLLQYVFQVVDRLAQNNERLMVENRDANEIIRDMMREKVQLDHELRMKELEFERSTAERKKWMQFAPALINTILGKEVFPQGTADTALVETIIDNISNEDIQLLATKLPPELMAPLMSRATEHVKKKVEKEEATRGLLGFKNGKQSS